MFGTLIQIVWPFAIISPKTAVLWNYVIPNKFYSLFLITAYFYKIQVILPKILGPRVPKIYMVFVILILGRLQNQAKFIHRVRNLSNNSLNCKCTIRPFQGSNYKQHVLQKIQTGQSSRRICGMLFCLGGKSRQDHKD